MEKYAATGKRSVDDNWPTDIERIQAITTKGRDSWTPRGEFQHDLARLMRKHGVASVYASWEYCPESRPG